MWLSTWIIINNYHQSCSDSISHRPSIANNMQHILYILMRVFLAITITPVSNHSLLSMRHHLQYPTTKHHWGLDMICLLPQSTAMFASLPQMVSRWCSLHATSSPWAFLARERPVSPSAAGETTVHTLTALPLLVGGASFGNTHSFAISFTTCILCSHSVDPYQRI